MFCVVCSWCYLGEIERKKEKEEKLLVQCFPFRPRVLVSMEIQSLFSNPLFFLKKKTLLFIFFWM